jgi:hypothetical protein
MKAVLGTIGAAALFVWLQHGGSGVTGVIDAPNPFAGVDRNSLSWQYDWQEDEPHSAGKLKPWEGDASEWRRIGPEEMPSCGNCWVLFRDNRSGIPDRATWCEIASKHTPRDHYQIFGPTQADKHPSGVWEVWASASATKAEVCSELKRQHPETRPDSCFSVIDLDNPNSTWAGWKVERP